MSVRSEFAGADFGDERLTARLGFMAELVAAAPEASFPKALITEAAREAAYRFLNSDAVSLDKILAPHVARTVERAKALGEVAVVHDTTEFGFSGSAKREGLGRLHQKGQGFFAHTALAVSADGQRRPVGVLGVETLFRLEAPKGKRTPSQLRKDPNNESLRWHRLVAECEERLKDHARLIHLMDREADAYDLLLLFAGKQLRFVVRAAHDRVVEGVVEDLRLRQALTTAPVLLEREVPISSRKRVATAQQNRIHPPREGRMAKLTFRAMPIKLKRPKHASHKQPASVAANVVHVWEVDCPADLKPVEWILLTSEPITSPAEVARVVDLYRARWVIEEYFKALKTGCSYERRQLESSHSLLNALGLFMPIAWRLLLLRALSRAEDSVPATEALPEIQVEALVAMTNGKLGRTPTVQEAMQAIARLGGHIKSNGKPGWQVLWRGYRDLLAFAAGWAAARGQRCDPS